MPLPSELLVSLVSIGSNDQCGNPSSRLILLQDSNPPAYYDDGEGDFDAAMILPIGSPIINWELRIINNTGSCTLTLSQPFRMSSPPSGVATNPAGEYCGWVSGQADCNARRATVAVL